MKYTRLLLKCLAIFLCIFTLKVFTVIRLFVLIETFSYKFLPFFVAGHFPVHLNYVTELIN